MFIQLALALGGIFLLYVGIAENSILNICLGLFLIISSTAMFYAAKTGSSIQEKIGKWQEKESSKQ